jgi:probable ATP-dependent RNA helicase DDX4
MDFLEKGIISFEDLRYLILDEADRMLDMGFHKEIQKLCAHESIQRDSLTTLMFSATFPEAIQHLAAAFLRDYLFLSIGIVGGASTDVEQEFIEVSRFKKRAMLSEILEEYCNCAEEDRILVFVDTKRNADFLASFMSETKIR